METVLIMRTRWIIRWAQIFIPSSKVTEEKFQQIFAFSVTNKRHFIRDTYLANECKNKSFGNCNQHSEIQLHFIFGFTGSSLLHSLSPVSERRGHSWLSCKGFSCCRGRALGAWASIIAANMLSSCITWALEHASLSSRGTLDLVAPTWIIFPGEGSNSCSIHW